LGACERVVPDRLARHILRGYGLDPSALPAWQNDDCALIYIFGIGENRGDALLAFKVEHEDRNGSLRDACPAPTSQ